MFSVLQHYVSNNMYTCFCRTYGLHRPDLMILDPELARDILVKNFSRMPNRSVTIHEISFLNLK